jgi:hypothetical protein
MSVKAVLDRYELLKPSSNKNCHKTLRNGHANCQDETFSKSRSLSRFKIERIAVL